MTRSLLFSLLLLPALASAAPASNAGSSQPVRRFALLVGVNDGGPGRAKLRYAVTDARSFGDVLEELGGVQPQDRMMLMEGGRAELEGALAKFKAMIAAAKTSGGRTEALVYYSGHSDEEGLLLQQDRFGYKELRQALESLPADVRIAILDSCASGTLARQKGGVRRPSFLVDASTAVRGHAILTSSSEDEVSQESDRIGGSFFTHNLVSGMRGAADATGDGRVTLHEAYQFAFHETLARTEQTRAGAQHPAYDIELAGTGELVMTDLRSTAAVLVLGEMLDGRLYVRDAPGRLVVELKKFAGRATELGLQPGRYTVMRESLGVGSQAELVLDQGGRFVLAETAFRPVGLEMTAMRGGGTPRLDGVKPAMGGSTVEGPAHQHRPINLGLFPSVQTNDLFGGTVDNNFSLALAAGRTARLNGVALALGANWATDSVTGLQLAIGGNVARADVTGGQFAVGGNWASGAVGGVQVATGLNIAQQGGLAGQLAVGGNLSRAPLSGAQLSVGTNWVQGAFDGVQGTVGLNAVRGRMEGVQMSVGMNWADTARGMQLSLLNVGDDVKGMQLGLINIAGKMSGLQLGLVNVAREMDSGLPIGALSIVKNGQFHIEAFGSDINFANTALKVGSRHFYTTVVVGMGHVSGAQGPSHWTLGFGLGGHIPVSERFFVDVDGVTHSVYDWDSSFTTTRLLHQVRVIGGFQVAKSFTLIGGPTMNLLHGVDGDAITALSTFSRQGPKHFIWWPGMQVGVRL
ncbi:caspase family protein [Pyxidicoccus caerfyrddinensis]|uniref:caspase family protein n=1 Tax=Pyxidicoccus caerfyrddinensis TaxID=2709663 RepID=UPI0013DCDB9A|nr:caspase family protein [Pyxidicoccus caerfyrddinensis]